MNRSTTIKGLVAGAGAVAALVAPLALAAPAQATVTKDRCTVAPQLPEFSGAFDQSTGQKLFDYDIEVTCNQGRSIEIDAERWESDLVTRPGDDGDSEDDKVGETTFNEVFASGIGTTTRTVSVRRTLALNMDSDNFLEMYQKVRFKVTKGGVVGSWSTFDLTQAASLQY